MQVSHLPQKGRALTAPPAQLKHHAALTMTHPLQLTRQPGTRSICWTFCACLPLPADPAAGKACPLFCGLSGARSLAGPSSPLGAHPPADWCALATKASACLPVPPCWRCGSAVRLCSCQQAELVFLPPLLLKVVLLVLRLGKLQPLSRPSIG